MSLIFTDQQLKDISKEYLSIPLQIIKLNQTLADLVILKQKLLDQDTANKVFSDNFINILVQYHEELKNLNGSTRSNYNESILVQSAQFLSGNEHFPTSPAWVNFQPKLAASNNGSPISATTPNESTSLTDVAPPIAQLVSGFTDGAATELLTSAYAGGVFDVANPTALVVGNRVVVSQGGVSAYGVITSIVPGMTDDTVAITELAPPAGALGIGASVSNFHAGFTNNQRSGIDPITEPEYYNYLTAIIDSKVAAIEGFLNAELAALNLNDAIGIEATQITAAKATVNAFKLVIDTWQAAAFRFNDANLAPLQAAIATRPADITFRVGEIIAAIGSVVQNPDGTFVSLGNYGNLFNFVNIRINRIEGSLVRYYGIDMAKRAIDQKIATLQSKKAEYEDTFVIVALTADTDGTDILKFASVVGFAVTNAIKVMDDDQPVISRTILAITLLNVQVNSVVPVGYLISKGARVVKQL